MVSQIQCISVKTVEADFLSVSKNANNSSLYG